MNEFPENTGLILAVWEIINPGNIGQIIRLGHNIGARKILFVNDKPDFRESKNIFSAKLPKKAIMLAGNESHGIPAYIIEKSNCKTFIPMRGGCKSMNVSHRCQ